MQQDDFAQHGRFAAAAPADQREYLAVLHREAHVAVYDRGTERSIQIAYLDDGRIRTGTLCASQHNIDVGTHIFSQLNAMENSASARITRKIDCTTLLVVCCPTLSALPLT